MTAVAQTAARARCAGLRHALLNDWQRGFPLQPSPFQVLAQRLGGSLREVLGHCHALADEGSLDAIRVQWSPALQRVRWRCGLRLPQASAAPDEALRAALAALPGVVGYDRFEAGAAAGEGGPMLWFELAARDEAAGRAQLAWFEARHGPLQCVPLDAPPPTRSPAQPACGCAPHSGPCADPELARCCEAGLPLVAHPYRNLSESVRRTEREVIARLRGWQREGRVLSLGLATTAGQAGAAERLFHAAALALPLDEAAVDDEDRRQALLARPGILGVAPLPGASSAAPALLLVAAGSAAQAEALIARALAACGLGGLPCRPLRLHRVRWRDAPLLFTDIGEPPPAARPAGTPRPRSARARP